MLPSTIYSGGFFVLMTISIMTLLSFAKGKKIDTATMDNCEVCLVFMTRFIEELDSDTKSDPKKIEAAFRKKCKHTKKDDNRFCYYVGGLEESATGIVSEMSKPVSWSMPPEKVCAKLNKKDSQICELKYDKTIDLATINLKKLKVKDLKHILSDWDETCKGCTEKSDYVKLIEELLPKYAPEAHKARQKTEL